MKLEPFHMERIMSEWQNEVEFDLTPSGVEMMHLSELLSLDELSVLHDQTRMRFVQTNGPVPLREAIVRLYPGAGVGDVLVTNGSCEALMVTLWRLCDPGMKVVQLSPTYAMVGGLARSFGCDVVDVRLDEEAGWKLDLEALDEAVTSDTGIVYICNPNNPTGSFLAEDEVLAIVEVAARAKAWLIADEIYRGGELDGQTPSFWGRYDKLLVTSSLSKVYRLAGLRIGWVVGPAREVGKIWEHHDYTTTTIGALNTELACLALEPERGARIIAKTHEIARERLGIFESWVADHQDRASYVPTRIAGHAFFGYRFDMPSADLADMLRQRYGVLLAPGAYFGAEHHFRVGYGVSNLEGALTRLSDAFDRDLASI